MPFTAYPQKNRQKKRYRIKNEELQFYKSEVSRVIVGSSGFRAEVLNELIMETKEQIALAQNEINRAQADIDSCKQLSGNIEKQYDKIITWADLFNGCTTEAKKMIISQFIQQVRVEKDYNIEIDLNVGYEIFAKC